jgi:hypothetical protein
MFLQALTVSAVGPRQGKPQCHSSKIILYVIVSRGGQCYILCVAGGILN